MLSGFPFFNGPGVLNRQDRKQMFKRQSRPLGLDGVMYAYESFMMSWRMYARARFGLLDCYLDISGSQYPTSASTGVHIFGV